MEADASQLCSQADILVGILDPLIPISERVWMGPAADEFEASVRSHAALLAAESDHIKGIAGELQRAAAVKRHQAAEMRVRALGIEAAATITGAI